MYEKLGKAIPPPKDRKPTMGSYKDMPAGVMPQPEQYDMEEQQQDGYYEGQVS